MTETQKQQILTLRQQGHTIAGITAAVNVPYNTVKTFCYRHKTKMAETEQKAMQAPVIKPDHCLNCGAPIVQATKQKPKKFCSAKCRETWWNINHRTDGLNISHCAYCGEAFEKYKHAAKRYCNHACYIKHRFGEITT